MKMLRIIFKLILFIFSFGLAFAEEIPELQILGIEPNAGPDYGETKVVVRLDKLTKDLISKFPSPKVKN